MPVRNQTCGISTREVLSATRAAIAIVAVLSGCGGGERTAPTAPVPVATPTPVVPTTRADLSATVTSPEADRRIECWQDVTARVTLTNRGQTPVSVGAVIRNTSLISGGCGVSDWVYPRSQLVSPGETSTVLTGPLYTGGAGCCLSERCNGSATCSFDQTFTIVTSVGELVAGNFRYSVRYIDCERCRNTGQSALAECAPPSER